MFEFRYAINDSMENYPNLISLPGIAFVSLKLVEMSYAPENSILFYVGSLFLLLC